MQPELKLSTMNAQIKQICKASGITIKKLSNCRTVYTKTNGRTLTTVYNIKDPEWIFFDVENMDGNDTLDEFGATFNRWNKDKI